MITSFDCGILKSSCYQKISQIWKGYSIWFLSKKSQNWQIRIKCLLCFFYKKLSNLTKWKQNQALYETLQKGYMRDQWGDMRNAASLLVIFYQLKPNHPIFFEILYVKNVDLGSDWNCGRIDLPNSKFVFSIDFWAFFVQSNWCVAAVHIEHLLLNMRTTQKSCALFHFLPGCKNQKMLFS